MKCEHCGYDRNTLGDNGVIAYDEHGLVVRESFGRQLSPLETALCDALDKRNIEIKTLMLTIERTKRFETVMAEARMPRTMGHGL